MLARTGAARRYAVSVALAVLLAAAAGGVAQARVVFVHGRAYGVMRAPGAAPVAGIAPAARRVSPLTVGGPQPPLAYGGGPLMLSSKLYLIFWGPSGSFPSSYTAPIVQYAKDLQTDDSLTTDEFSVADQYANGKGAHISGEVTFGGEVFDTTAYPALDKAHGCATAPCVTDAQIQTESLKEIEANGWPTDPASAPQAQYLVYTPSGVSSCIEAGSCTFSTTEGFCAYHGQITGIAPGGRVATYSDLPYQAECDSGQAPAGVAGNKDADGTLDSEIHELVESATDPSNGTGYTDAKEYEAADKCVETEAGTLSQLETYGAPLGGSLSEFTAFNQLIGGHSYYTQQIWSNAPTKTPASTEAAGCVARIGPTPAFTASESPQAGQPVSFDAGGSYDISAPITGYAWNYGDGSPVDATSGVRPSHVYANAGIYQVSLTVTDSSGSADASTQTLPIAISAAPLKTVTEPPTTSGGGSTAGSSGSGTGSGSGTSGSGSTGAVFGPGPVAPTAGPPSGETTVLTRTQKLTQAITACQKLRKSKRAVCIAAAKRRFAPVKTKHKQTKRKPKKR